MKGTRYTPQELRHIRARRRGGISWQRIVADERDKLHERWLESGSPSWSDWIYDEAASLRAALREAEAQRDAWREEGYLMVERVNADHERAETAERERDVARQAHDDADAALQSLMAKYDPKVAEYRQALEPFAGGGHAYGYDDCKWCVAAKVLARGEPVAEPVSTGDETSAVADSDREREGAERQ